MAVATTQDMGKVDGATKTHGTLAILEEIGATKVMGTKAAGASLIAILVVDISRDMEVAQLGQTIIRPDLSLTITQVSTLIQ